MTATTNKRQPKDKKPVTVELVRRAQKKLGKEQDEILFAIEAMRTAHRAKPPVRYRISRLVYRGT